MKYENARSWKFNWWAAVAASIAVTFLSVWQMFNRVTAEMDIEIRAGYLEWLEAHGRAKAMPGAGLTQEKMRTFISDIEHYAPGVHEHFVDATSLIFYWTPVMAVVGTIFAFIFGHAIASWWRQTHTKN